MIRILVIHFILKPTVTTSFAIYMCRGIMMIQAGRIEEGVQVSNDAIRQLGTLGIDRLGGMYTSMLERARAGLTVFFPIQATIASLV